MLRAKVLPQVLNQAATAGIASVILCTAEGQVLGGTATDAAGAAQQATLAAIVTNIHGEYQKAAARAFGGGSEPGFEAGAVGSSASGVGADADSPEDVDELRFLVMDFEGGRVGMASVCGRYLLVAHADAAVETGMLKLKLERLRDWFEGPGGLAAIGDTEMADRLSEHAEASPSVGTGAAGGAGVAE